MSLDIIRKLEKRLYLKYGAFLLLGIILIGAGIRMKGIMADLFVITGMLVGIGSLMLISVTIDLLYRTKGKIREEETGEVFRETYIDWPAWTKRYGWILTYLFIFLFIGLLARKHENNFGGNTLIWHSLLAGALTGLFVYQVLKLRFTNWTSDRNKAIEIGFWIVVVTMILFVGLAPALNQWLAHAPVNCREYAIAEKPSPVKKSRSKYLSVFVNDRVERFQPPASLIRKLGNADSVLILCVQRGALGYEFVREFKRKEQQVRTDPGNH